MPKISVLMSVYNGEEHLRESVLSILAQSCGDFELIVVDDGSIDKTSALLEEISNSDHRVVVLRNIDNIGLTKSLNRGLMQATGAYIARHDCGDISHPERFKKQLAFFAANPGYAMCGTAMEVISERGEVLKREQVVTGDTNIKAQILSKNLFVHGSVMIDSSVLRQLSGYNESFSRAQDYELFLRISAKYPVDNINEFLYKYRLDAKGISLSNTFEQCVFAEKARNAAKGVPEAHISVARARSQSFVEHGRYSMLNGDRFKAFKLFVRAFLSYPTLKGLLRCVRPVVG